MSWIYTALRRGGRSESPAVMEDNKVRHSGDLQNRADRDPAHAPRGVMLGLTLGGALWLVILLAFLLLP